MNSAHTPVLTKEVLQYLDPKPNENFIDCTLGGGGHTKAILEKNKPRGRVLGIDWDASAVGIQHKRITIIHDNFANIKDIAAESAFKPVHGVLFDLGFSSDQLEHSGRGFSFQKEEPLDMRYNAENPTTAEKIVNYSSRYELERILREYGQEKFAKQIAKTIVEQRPFSSTKQLADCIHYKQKSSIHPATRTFQALRIAVNDELTNIRKGIEGAKEIVAKGGKIVVISFHSLEDRIAKEMLGSRPILPSIEEIQSNPRARSAKLRAVTV
jgi:16S rRNA (cytosine1402-N4)-methyltransferase